MNAYGSDKPFHSFAGKTYLDVYESHLENMEVMALLELGVYQGDSLKMWRDLLPAARIVGVDINPSTPEIESCDVIICAQDDASVLSNLGDFDVVIDDASHLNRLTLQSFAILWPHVTPGGFYAIEDLDCSYLDLTESSETWPGMAYVEDGRANDRDDMDVFFLRLIREMDRSEGDVCEVSFTSKLCVIRKAP